MGYNKATGIRVHPGIRLKSKAKGSVLSVVCVVLSALAVLSDGT